MISTTTSAPASSATATVSLVSHGAFGKIMVDSNGMTLYEDEKDKPGNPNCTGACLTVWPAVVAPTSPTYGPGLSASTFSVVTLADGTKQLAANGFPLYTFAVIAGAIWAEAAWGRFWGWDPKETVAFIAWVIYAAYLHARATAGWRNGRAAWVNVLGLVAVVFNLFFINLVVAGLHSYAGVN